MKLTEMKQDRRTEKKAAEEGAWMRLFFVPGLATYYDHTFDILIVDRTIPLLLLIRRRPEDMIIQLS